MENFMRKKILLAIGTIIVSSIALIPFSKYKINESIHPPVVPEIEELENYLSKSESQFSQLTPGTEKTILWASSDKQQTEYAIIFFHGFGASAPELYPLIPLVSKDLQANVYFPRLKGHGLTGEELAKATGNDWLNDAIESYLIARKLGKKIIIVGSSTGCLLGMWLATKEEYRKDIAGLILMSSNFHPAAAFSDITLYPAGMELIKLLYGKERYWEPQNENVAKYWQHKYPWEALIPMMTLVDYSSKFPYETMETPALFLYSEKDDVVDIQKIKEVHSKYKSSKKKILEVKEADGHVMAGDCFSPQSTEIVKEIIVSYIKEIQ
jgi:esterase/lipase